MGCHGLVLKFCVCGSTNTKSLYWLKGVEGNSPNFLEQHLKANRCPLTTEGVVRLFDAEDCLGFVWLGALNYFSCWFCQIPRWLKMNLTHFSCSTALWGRESALSSPAQLSGHNHKCLVIIVLKLAQCLRCLRNRAKCEKQNFGRKISESNRSSNRESPLKFWGGKEGPVEMKGLSCDV